MEIEILVFEINGQRFGIRAVDVVEVLRAATLTPLPTAPSLIEGLLNLRGRVVPVLDVRERLGLPRKEMQMLRRVVGDDGDALRLLDAARRAAMKRVIVKRPDHAPPLAPDVTMSYPGKLVRLDVYVANIAD